MIQLMIILIMIFNTFDAVVFYDEEEATTNLLNPESELKPIIIAKRKSNAKDLVEFEPVNPLQNEDKIIMTKNINCEDFFTYTKNCTEEAAILYNSTKMFPPLPEKIFDWCSAIRHLMNCATDWNFECRDVTDDRFNEESVNGNMYVLESICDSEWFISRYNELPQCIEATSETWDVCYTTFKYLVDEQKNKSQEWTHYETHFLLCCARAQFRKCTLEALTEMPDKCTQEQAKTLQKFGIIVSEGEVFQDCETNMVYSNCPGGDPRPPKQMILQLSQYAANNGVNKLLVHVKEIFIWQFCLYYMIFRNV